MKKIYSFLGIALILFFVFACTIPSEVEIKGSPSLKFAANINFGDFFSDMIDGVLNTDNYDVQILDCTNSSLQYKTFIIHMEVFRDDDYECEIDEAEILDIGDTGSIWINDIEIPGEVILGEVIDGISTKRFLVLDDDREIASSKEPYKVSFKGFGDYLDGFGFTGLESKMYIYGTNIVNALSINLYNIDSEGNEKLITSDITSGKNSGIESLKEYPGLELPDGGVNIDIIDIINSKDDLSMAYKVILKKGTTVDLEWLKDTQVVIIEIAIWLPMTFESMEENASFNFPGYFDGISDVFKSFAETGFIESMKIKIGLHPLNPFGRGLFVIRDNKYDPIQNPLDENSFSFVLSKRDLEYINKNPFDPSFLIIYPQKHSILGIPKGDIMITTVSLDTELKYKKEF